MRPVRPTSSSPPGRNSRGTARERLLTTARTLFFAEGIRATGIDRVIAESQIAKATLYNHFATKEDLVVAVLETHLADWQAEVLAVDRAAAPPVERIAELFDALAGAVRTGRFRGCPFSNALTELPDSATVRTVAERYRALQLDHIGGIIGSGPTDTTVRAIVLLLEGATTVTKTTGAPDEILIARDVAVALLAAGPSRHSSSSGSVEAATSAPAAG